MVTDKKKKNQKPVQGNTQQLIELQQFREALIKGLRVNHEKDDAKSVVVNDLRSNFHPDAFAVGLLEDTTPDWMPERLQAQMKNALRGFSEGMALEVADNLLDCYSYGVRHYIGIEHIDKLLNSLYNKIQYAASQKGVRLPNHF